MIIAGSAMKIAVPRECVHVGIEFPRPCGEMDDVSMDDGCEPRAAGEWKNLTFGHSVAISCISLPRAVPVPLPTL